MKLKLFIVFLFINVFAYSQHGFRPGYIVNKDGKTEDGLINNQGNEFNAKKCEFKKDPNANPVAYLPGDIIAYRITDNKYFISKKVLMDDKEINIFLECLVSGKATIYYTQWNAAEHYYLEKDGKLVEMNNHVTDVVINGETFQHPSNQYKGILKYYFQDCPQMTDELDKADFSKKSMIQISKDYNGYVCNDEQCIVYEKKVRKKTIQLGVDFSYGTTKLNFFDIKMQMSRDPKNQFQVGVNSQINLDEDGTFNLQVALRYYSYKTEWYNGVVTSMGILPDIEHSSDVKYQFSMLKPGIQLKYRKEIRKIVPFAAIGLFTNYFLTDDGVIYNERLNTTIPFNSGGIENQKGKMNWMFGGSFELGVETKLKPGIFSFSLFYENFLSNPFRTSYNMGLRCGYSFNLK